MTSFSAFAARKVHEADAAPLTPLTTIEDCSARFDLIPVGNQWTRDLYDGPFHLPTHSGQDLPVVSLVFVQSRDRNTGAHNPEQLGGGPVDKHLIYEGLSRVAADAVMAGAKTVEGPDVFFSVWRPEHIALRAALGLPRHPAQVIVTGSGCVDLERTLMFNVPDVHVFILANPGACARLEQAASRRPMIELVPIPGDDLRPGLEYLRRTRRIARISAIGGRTTASALIDAGLVQDLLLTTTDIDGGEPGTPFYVGATPPVMSPIVRKRGTDPKYPITLEHMMLESRV